MIDDPRATENTDYDRVRQRIEELQVSIAEQRQILSMKENEQTNFRQLLDDERQRLFEQQSAVKEQEDTVRKRRGMIQQLKGAKDNHLTIYGRHTLAILKEIERNAQRFKQMPIGPVGRTFFLASKIERCQPIVIEGRHIRLLDRKWAIAVEQAIGGQMTGYLCSSRDDERVLLEILSRCVPPQDMDYRPNVTGQFSSTQRDPSNVSSFSDAISVSTVSEPPSENHLRFPR